MKAKEESGGPIPARRYAERGTYIKPGMSKAERVAAKKAYHKLKHQAHWAQFSDVERRSLWASSKRERLRKKAAAEGRIPRIGKYPTEEARLEAKRTKGKEAARKRSALKRAAAEAVGKRVKTPSGTFVRSGMSEEARKEAIRLRTAAKYQRKKQNAIFVIASRVRTRIWHAVRTRWANPNLQKRTISLLGCSFEELKRHIEKKLKKGMTWEDVMTRKVHLDHIVPVYAFDLRRPEEVARCFHYTNLQPMWAAENLRKGRRTPKPRQLPLLKHFRNVRRSGLWPTESPPGR